MRMAGDGFVEQPDPGGAAGDLFLVQQLFQLVGELVRAEHTQVAQPGPPAGQRGIGEFLFQHGSSSRFSSSVKNSKWLEMAVTRSVIDW